jgi:phosphinothricin acetyltransferase
MVIRHADPQRDAAGCVAIYGPYVRDTPASFEEREPGAEELARRIELISRTHPWLVADDLGELTGFAYASPHRERPAYRWAADLAVYVAQDRRGAGIGRALYGALIPLLERQGLRIVCAGITLPNEASVALHESFGLELVGVYRRIGWKAGAWHDVGWWQRELGSPDGSPGPPRDPGPPARLARPVAL